MKKILLIIFLFSVHFSYSQIGNSELAKNISNDMDILKKIKIKPVKMSGTKEIDTTRNDISMYDLISSKEGEYFFTIFGIACKPCYNELAYYRECIYYWNQYEKRKFIILLYQEGRAKLEAYLRTLEGNALKSGAYLYTEIYLLRRDEFFPSTYPESILFKNQEGNINILFQSKGYSNDMTKDFPSSVKCDDDYIQFMEDMEMGGAFD
jgi:hypothetical protein